MYLVQSVDRIASGSWADSAAQTHHFQSSSCSWPFIPYCNRLLCCRNSKVPAQLSCTFLQSELQPLPGPAPKLQPPYQNHTSPLAPSSAASWPVPRVIQHLLLASCLVLVEISLVHLSPRAAPEGLRPAFFLCQAPGVSTQGFLTVNLKSLISCTQLTWQQKYTKISNKWFNIPWYMSEMWTILCLGQWHSYKKKKKISNIQP